MPRAATPQPRPPGEVRRTRFESVVWRRGEPAASAAGRGVTRQLTQPVRPTVSTTDRAAVAVIEQQLPLAALDHLAQEHARLALGQHRLTQVDERAGVPLGLPDQE